MSGAEPPFQHPRPSGTTHRSSGPDASYAQVDRLAILVEELGGLVDGSLKSLAAARSSLAVTTSSLGEHIADEACRHLTHAAGRLEKMSELVHAAMQSDQHVGSPSLAKARPVTLGEAIEHATELLSSLCGRHHIEVTTRLTSRIATSPVGPLYTVILNALQNAVESVISRGGDGHITIGVVECVAPANAGYGRDSRTWLEMSITDDGLGPPRNPSESARVFDLGYTTKKGRPGLGLALARSVVQSMGGTIELACANPGDSAGHRGGLLRVRFPVPSADARFGHAA